MNKKEKESSMRSEGKSIRITRELETIRTKWYAFDKRSPLLSARVIGLNLQAKVVTNFFFTKELKTTIFMLELHVVGTKFCWTVQRTFDELHDFHQFTLTDPALLRGRELLKVGFPPGKDGEVDTMILVDRREQIEAFLQEIVANIDFREYDRLAALLETNSNIEVLCNLLKRIVGLFRRHMARRKAKELSVQRLMFFYSKELMDFGVKFENGIEVYDIDMLGSERTRSHFSTPEVHVLWLEYCCEDPVYSRICLGRKSIFSLPKDNVDARVSNGLYLSDVAEIRCGASSHSFRAASHRQKHALVKQFFTETETVVDETTGKETQRLKYFRHNHCVSIVGTERTLSFQFVHDETAPRELDSCESSSGESSHSSVLQRGMDRSLFVDMLRLAVLDNLKSMERQQRNAVFFRCHPHSSCRPPSPKDRATKKEREDALLIKKLLEEGLDVYEENYSPRLHSFVKTRKRLVLDNEHRKLHILCVRDGIVREPFKTDATDTIEEDLSSSDDEEESMSSNNNRDVTEEAVFREESVDSLFQNLNEPAWILDMTTQDRNIDIDDISEVRRGKLCHAFDSQEDMQCISIVASEAVIVLSMHGETESACNIFARKLQSFVKMFRDVSIFETGLPSKFAPHCLKKEKTCKQIGSTELPSFRLVPSTSGRKSEKEFGPAHHLLTHSNAIRSMSIFRQSSQSSKGGASFSENLSAMRESSLEM